MLPEDMIALLLEEAKQGLTPYTGAGGAVTFDAPVHVVTAISP